MKLKLPDLKRSSGSIPQLPVWEIVAITYIAIYSASALLTGRETDRISVLLGPSWGSLLWYGGLCAASIACIIGMTLPSPNGLIINLAGMMTIFLLAFSVGTGFALMAGTVFFSGNAGMWIFALGGLLRSIQLFNTLTRLEKSIVNL